MEDPHRLGSFICVIDIHGLRHALRLNSISAVRDADEDRTETLISFNGGRDNIIVPIGLERVLPEILDPAGRLDRGSH